MKARKWTAEEKMAIVLEDLKEKRSVAEICREHKISQTLYYRGTVKLIVCKIDMVKQKGVSSIDLINFAKKTKEEYTHASENLN